MKWIFNPLLKQGFQKIVDKLSDLTGFITDSRVSRDYGYAIGGYDGTNTLSTTEKYDDTVDTWTTVQSLNIARYSLACFELNGFVYATGGKDNAVISTTEKYDDVVDAWTTKANLNMARQFLAGFSLSGFGYAIGGYDGTNTLSTTEKYDDVVDAWTTKVNLNVARWSLAGFSLNGYGYTSGGNDGTYDIATTERYDDVSDVWVVKSNLTIDRMYVNGFSLNGFGYNAGGGRYNDKYDDVADTWVAKSNLPYPVWLHACFSLNGYGYVIGGYDLYNPISTTIKYTDVTDSWTTVQSLNNVRWGIDGSTIGAIKQGVQLPDITPILRIIRDVDNPRVAASAITSAMIQASAVTEPKIADSAVTNQKIADNTIQPVKLAFGTWEKVAEITVSADTDYVDFTDLDINSDGVYKLFASIVNPTGSGCLYSIYVNGDYTLTNYYTEVLTANGTTVASNRENASDIAYALSNDVVVFDASIFRDANSYVKVIANTIERSSLNILFSNKFISSSSTFTNITSLRISASVTGGIGAGSHFILAKVKTA